MVIVGKTYLDFQGLEPNTWYEVSVRKRQQGETHEQSRSTEQHVQMMLTDANGDFVNAKFANWEGETIPCPAGCDNGVILGGLAQGGGKCFMCNGVGRIKVK